MLYFCKMAIIKTIEASAEGAIVFASGYPALDGIKQLGDMVAEGKMPQLSKLISRRVPMNEENINEAFDVLEKHDRCAFLPVFHEKCTYFSLRTLLIFE